MEIFLSVIGIGSLLFKKKNPLNIAQAVFLTHSVLLTSMYSMVLAFFWTGPGLSEKGRLAHLQAVLQRRRG
jgi:hypothetical protein